MRELISLVAALVASTASAQPAPAPKLTVVISVDQLSSDLFDQYRLQFSGGLARLAGGTMFRNAYQSHAATETCPGHATILTGGRPARTGIIANQWIDPSVERPDKTIYCAENERVPGSNSRNYTLSAVHLKMPTLGELMKRRWPTARNVAVGGKDRSAMMMAGNGADQLWYWDGKGFATNLKSAALPRSVAATNAAVAQAISSARDPLVPPPLCAAKARPIAVEGHAPVGAGTFARTAGDVNAFRASPEFDAAMLALSAALIGEMKLGQGGAPDILSIGLAATDFVGHYFGTGGQEMCLQLLALDRDLGDFFAVLDASGVDYAVALTSDHGGEDLPERLRLGGIAAAQRVDPELAAPAVGKVIAAKLGLTGPLLFGDVSGDIYVGRNLKPADQARVLAEAVRAYRLHPQVAAVFTREELKRTPLAVSTPDRWSLLERARASFDAQRSGDLIVVLKEHVTPIGHVTRAVATHGTPWDYDRRVPILLWRRGMAPALREEAVETIDIMPTLSAMLGVTLASGAVDGKCLNHVAGIICPTR